MAPPIITALAILDFKRNATLRQIEIICTLARVGSVTKTAEVLRMSASNVSRTCQRFEGHFDFPIFEKKRKGVRLAPEGKAILDELLPLYACIETTADRLTALFERSE